MIRIVETERKEIEIILERLLHYIGIGIIWILGHCNKLKYILKSLEKSHKKLKTSTYNIIFIKFLVFIFLSACMLNIFSHVTLCDLINCRPPSSFVHGDSLGKILGWVVMPSSRGSSCLRDQTHFS